MKTKEHYVEEYIEHLYGDIEEHERPMYAPDIAQSKKDFEMGFYYGQPKWISVPEQLPKEDISVLCKIINDDIPEILRYEVCRYYQENWYGDFDIDDKVVQWMEIPQ